jgi:hypothetical protein
MALIHISPGFVQFLDEREQCGVLAIGSRLLGPEIAHTCRRDLHSLAQFVQALPRVSLIDG